MQDDQIEDNTLKQMLVLEREFREHNALMKTEVDLQKELIARLWTVSQRYNLLESTRDYADQPFINAIPTEDAFFQEFADKLKELEKSNDRINISLNELRNSCLIFNILSSQLDMSNETPLIIGDAFHKPITYFIELFIDLFKYFHVWLLKLQYLYYKFEPVQIDGIENYKKQLQPSEEFEEYLKVGLTYCKFLQPKTKF